MYAIVAIASTYSLRSKGVSVTDRDLIVHAEFGCVVGHVEGAGWAGEVAPAPALWGEAGQHRVGLRVLIGHSVEPSGIPVSSALAHRLTLTTPTVVAGGGVMETKLIEHTV